MFPFAYKIGQGKGKKSLIKMTDKCISDRYGKYCATERYPDCLPKLISYCDN